MIEDEDDDFDILAEFDSIAPKLYRTPCPLKYLNLHPNDPPSDVPTLRSGQSSTASSSGSDNILDWIEDIVMLEKRPSNSKKKEETPQNQNQMQVQIQESAGTTRSIDKEFIIPPNYSNMEWENLPWNVDVTSPPKELKPKIISVVASTHFGCTFPLKKMAPKMINISYNSTDPRTMKLRIRTPVYATAMAFSSGWLVISGVDSVNGCLTAAKIFGGMIEDAGVKLGLAVLRIKNVMAVSSVGFRVRVNELRNYEQLKERIVPSPSCAENVSSVTIQWATNVRTTVFRTGRVMITGATKESAVDEAFAQLWPFCRMFKLM